MGTCFSDQTLKKGPSDNFYKQYQPTKKFNANSVLFFLMQTWPTQTLPNLKNQTYSNKKQFNFNKQGRIIYKEQTNQISFLVKQNYQKTNNLNYNQRPQTTLALQVIKSSNGYKITFLNEFIYELITVEKQILEGDKFLFGGTQYKFVKLIQDKKYGQNKVKKLSEIKNPLIVQTQDYMKSYSKIPVQQDDTQPSCRICLEQQSSQENPLICPCNCTGSVKYYHLKCWSAWIFSSQLSNEGLYIGNVIRQYCQLCKKNLLEDQNYRQTVAAVLSSVAKIKTPFIVLEGLKPLSNFPYYRSVKLSYIIVSFAQKQKYIVGRGSVDIPLVIDSSISRKNNSLQIKDGKIYIQDAGSKHGTYVRIQDSIIIKNDVPRYFLYNNHLISLKIK